MSFSLDDLPPRYREQALEQLAKKPAKAKAPRENREAKFQRNVIQVARALGWTVAHFRPARTKDGNWRTPVAADGKGFPDLVLAKAGRILFVELKTERGRLSTHQEKWKRELNPSGTYRVWTPLDWKQIEVELAQEQLWQQSR